MVYVSRRSRSRGIGGRARRLFPVPAPHLGALGRECRAQLRREGYRGIWILWQDYHGTSTSEVWVSYIIRCRMRT